METLKPLSAITEPDPRHRAFVMVDPSVREGVRSPTVADYYAEAATLELSEHVPETVRSAFAVARMLWVYGWYYWPLHTVAGFDAYRCLELALTIKSAQVDGDSEPRGRTPPLAKLLQRAIRDHWISDVGIAQVQRHNERRQRHLESMPREWLGDFPSEPEDAQKYCKVLLETAPYQRVRSSQALLARPAWLVFAHVGKRARSHQSTLCSTRECIPA